MMQHNLDKAVDRSTGQALPGIKHLVAIASAKGGVGKSTIAVNLALTLVRLGQRVGLVDADVLGPSIPGMLGLASAQAPEIRDGLIVPAFKHGLKAISMGMLTDDDNPAVMRGPMVSKYIQMFFKRVLWNELDYLIIDLPPGTGDTQLTLAQQLPLSGVIIVTTPQEVSLKIARRGLRMFEQVQVPILGVIENMSGFACPHCGTTTEIFRVAGGKRLSQETGVRFLGAIPIDVDIVSSGDAGEPLVITQPASATARAFLALADNIVGAVEQVGTPLLPGFDWKWSEHNTAPPWREDAIDPEHGDPEIPVGLRRLGAGVLSILWQDGVDHEYAVRDLRLACRCALCLEEMSGEALLDPNSVSSDVYPERIFSVGRYAISIRWSDGHDTGIYTFRRLRALGQQALSQQSIEL